MMARKQKNCPSPAGVSDNKKVATFVSGQGSDDDIRARCLESVEGWDKLSEGGKADMVRLMRQCDGRSTAPTIDTRLNEAGVTVIGTPEDANISLFAPRPTETFASSSQALADTRLGELAKYSSAVNNGQASADAIGAAVAFMHGSRPSNPVESALTMQMAATHDAAMRMLGRIGRAEYVDHLKVLGGIANKLLNTYARQAEVLSKLQRGGEQVVRHVHVDNRGGQAIVAETVVTGGSNGKRIEQPYEQGALSPALLGADALGFGMPVSGNPGQEALLPARRSIDGGAEG